MAPDFFATIALRVALQAHLARSMTVSLHHRSSEKIHRFDGPCCGGADRPTPISNPRLSVL